MRPFEGFSSKAIVLVPTDEEFKKRIEKRTKEEGKDVPDHAVLEMKGRGTRAGLDAAGKRSNVYHVLCSAIS